MPRRASGRMRAVRGAATRLLGVGVSIVTRALVGVVARRALVGRPGRGDSGTAVTQPLHSRYLEGTGWA